MEFLGSSESGGMASRHRRIKSDGTLTHPNWSVLSSVQWKCIDGRLAIKSPYLATDGWEVTNDKIEPTPDGRAFVLLGRVDRIVKIEEKRVSLTAVESRLVGSGWVVAAKACAITDARTLLAVAAIPSDRGRKLLKAEGKNALVKTLRKVLVQSLEAVCLPRRWRFVSEFPENLLGKTSLTMLEQLFEPGSLQYVVESQTGEAAELILTVDGQTPYFQGHFPDFALLPGVAQVQMTVELARRFFAMPPEFVGLKNLKFTRPIRPNATLIVKLDWKAQANELAFVWSGLEGQPCVRGVLCFAVAAGWEAGR